MLYVLGYTMPQYSYALTRLVVNEVNANIVLYRHRNNNIYYNTRTSRVPASRLILLILYRRIII